MDHFISKLLGFKLLQRQPQINLHKVLQSLDAGQTYWHLSIVSGSFYEGMPLDVCGDRDQMRCEPSRFIVYPEAFRQLIDGEVGRVVFIAETDLEQPAFVKLKLRGSCDSIMDNLAENITKDNFPYANSHSFVNETGNPDKEIHGPARTGLHVTGDSKFGKKDLVYCLACLLWPSIASEYMSRARNGGWPTQSTLETIQKDGCHVVPVGPPESRDKHLQWRWSFSLAEKCLCYSMNDPMQT